MATTRLMPLHTGKGRTVGQAISDIIDYTENPQKTDGGRLITSWQCDSRIADAEFLFTKNQYISDNVHAVSRLGNAEIFAVKTLPFHAIPQSVQRVEDCRKCPAVVMIDETHHVLKKQIRRLPGFSQAGQFKEESAARISESFSGSCNAESLARKSAAE